MPIMFAVKIVPLKFYITLSHSDDLALHPRSQLRLKFDKCKTCTISRTVFKLWHSTRHNGRLMHGRYVHALVDDLDLDARPQWIGKGNKSALNYLDNKATISIELVTIAGTFM